MTGLEKIKSSGILKIGTTGDYKPMSFYDGEKLCGIDILLSQKIADELKVKTQYVKTSWTDLEKDLLAEKFDVALSGITKTRMREEKFLMSSGYLKTGKTILCRKEDASIYKSLNDINRSDVRVMYNPGGTNEIFVKENLRFAQKIMFLENQEIPLQILKNNADVMITETVEAEYYSCVYKDLYSSLQIIPGSEGEFGVLFSRKNPELLGPIESVIGRFKERDWTKIL